MEVGKTSGSSLTSAAAFVEGGIQDACDDACSICLEAFCDSDPSTVTSCKHEYHLQCILECFTVPEKLAVPDVLAVRQLEGSQQELLDAVEHERNMRMTPPRNTTMFHHPALGDFELQHLPVNATESELEERIIQHLAAAAAMGRARQLARREGHRNRSSTQGHSHFLVFSTHPNGASAASSPPYVAQRDGSFAPNAVTIADSPNSPLITVSDTSQLIASGPSAAANQHQTSSSSNRRSPAQIFPGSQGRAGPSDLQSFSENLKSHLSALSTRYKESITRSTRGWKERLFARNTLTPNSSSAEVRREAEQSVGAVSWMVDHLEVAEDDRTSNTTTVSRNPEDVLSPDNTELSSRQ
ncbi:hypothetical protein OROGR_024691 [Orobanche gracilis]